MRGALFAATAQENGIWLDGSVATNPSDNDVIADTGQLTAGDYFVAFIMDASAAAKVDVEHRNAANNANDSVQRISIPEATTVEIVFPTKINLTQNERIRVIMNGALTGTIQASILYARITG